MKKIAIFYGSSSGNTETAAHSISKKALDEDNESDLTEKRISDWVAKLIPLV
jgi:flavodoxin